MKMVVWVGLCIFISGGVWPELHTYLRKTLSAYTFESINDNAELLRFCVFCMS